MSGNYSSNHRLCALPRREESKQGSRDRRGRPAEHRTVASASGAKPRLATMVRLLFWSSHIRHLRLFVYIADKALDQVDALLPRTSKRHLFRNFSKDSCNLPVFLSLLPQLSSSSRPRY